MNAARVIRISPMAHFASGFLACALLVLVPVWGNRALALLVIPVLLSVAIERLRTVAEGVEEEATARVLRELGVDVLQGFHFGRPCPAAELATLPLFAQS